MSSLLVIVVAVLYLGLLFGIAYYTEYKSSQGKWLINNPYIYSLSMAVYCTAWTYYGSVGRATQDGIMFLAIFVGPTIMAMFFIPVLGKIIRITKALRISSIADFVSTRYGKNQTLATLVTVLCILSVTPYISLQLKAITSSFDVLVASNVASSSLHRSSTFVLTLILAFFIILFGTRSVDATEKHPGMVAAIAFETIVKLLVFIIAGFFVTYWLFDGFGDISRQSVARPELQNLFVMDRGNSYISWLCMIFSSMMAILFLPRQFQVSVVENVRTSHLKKAVWVFPLYLLLINFFVLPIALGGEIMLGNSGVDPDTYVLALPLQSGNNWLGLLIFIGGFSAATSMIIVETIALSTMFSNNLVMPGLLRNERFTSSMKDSIGKFILYLRRFSILIILLLAYLYEKNVAEYFSLVSLGLFSFAGVTQFAPAIIGGIYWKGATKNGALAGIIAGFAIWFYTLVIPSLSNAGLVNPSIIENGLFDISWLRPHALFGLEGFDNITHCILWSVFFNVALFIGVSIYGKQSVSEMYQAEIFVNVNESAERDVWRGVAYLPDLKALLHSFLGKERSDKLLEGYAARNKISLDPSVVADSRLVNFSERLLSGVIGSASARIMVRSVTKEEEISIPEVMNILRESQQLINLNKELVKKSSELTKATNALRQANEQLKLIDASKDEFLYTVTHELRTPLTSIRAMAEIVHENDDLDEHERADFMGRIVKETERLSHLITQVLNLEKYESGRQRLNLTSFNLVKVCAETLETVKHAAEVKNVSVQILHPDSSVLVHADSDLIRQVILNLLSNAVKFSPENDTVTVRVVTSDEDVVVSVEDHGKGIPDRELPFIFDKFFQAHNQNLRKPQGSGLGLAISRNIIEMHNGRIWVESQVTKGSVFSILIPNFGVKN